MKHVMQSLLLVSLLAGGLAVSPVRGVEDPETVFRNPPQSAKTGVWWHWMGC